MISELTLPYLLLLLLTTTTWERKRPVLEQYQTRGREAQVINHTSQLKQVSR